jgi:hypothetical protein
MTEASASVAFGRFRVLPHRRQLLADRQPIQPNGCALKRLCRHHRLASMPIGTDVFFGAPAPLPCPLLKTPATR